jgi:Uma2 family endonuclease
MARTERRLMTADELLALPMGRGQCYELVEGVLRTMSPGGRRHGRVIGQFTAPLVQYVNEHHLDEVYGAETGFKLAVNPDTVRAPDVSFVRQERVAALDDEDGFVLGPPDLAVEVVSPGDRRGEIAETVAAWLATGTRMVVVVDPPRRRVMVHRPGQPPRELGEDDVLDGEDVVPGWQLPMRALFAGPERAAPTTS